MQSARRTTPMHLVLLLAIAVAALPAAQSVAVGERDPTCRCNKIYDPVCGQDGITYPNECEMGCFSVKLDHKGVCKKEGDTSTAPSPPNGIAVGERDPTCTCPLYFVYDPVCGQDGITYPSKCDMECFGVKLAHKGECEKEGTPTPSESSAQDGCMCAEIFMPVCGSDNVTYPNECQAHCAGIKAAYKGECKKDGAPAPPSGIAVGERDPTCTCPLYFVYDPVCGQDGITYPSKCDMECFGVKLAHKGECEKEGNPTPSESSAQDGCMCAEIYSPICGTNNKTYPNECQANCVGVKKASGGECGPTRSGIAVGERDPSCTCPAFLTDPVCGQDGITYPNECEMGCFGIKAAYKGECRKGGSTSAPSPPNGIAVGERDPTCTCPLYFVYDPVCGQDGITYPSKCDMECFGVKLAHKGECEKEGDASSTPEDGGCACYTLYDPVCGVNNKTYGNACEAGCANATVAHRGTCEDGCVCNAIYEPVCGVNNKTYSNECEAGCANVTVARKGACDGDCVCYASYMPVCGENNVTFGNDCHAACAGVKVKYPGECNSTTTNGIAVGERDPTCTCPLYFVYDPVCGQDGITYPSECEMGCFGVKLAHKGECKKEGGNSSTPEEGGCACYTLYDPVCGVNNKTYGNACEAGCANVTVARKGACEDGCVCDTSYAPVCGANNVTYSNECTAGCAGAKVASKGECGSSHDIAVDERDPSCTCPADVYDPVCGQDGRTYPNECEMGCFHVKAAYKGRCNETAAPSPPRTCGCPPIGGPVCGVDGKTYSNKCWAACDGVDVAHEGRCGSRSPPSPAGEGCACNLIYAPVCGADNKTYANSCEAGCANVTVRHNGTCEGGCVCDASYAPVCGTNNVTYSNGCQAQCAGAQTAYSGNCSDTWKPCNKACIDPLAIYTPVCGVDNKTYVNECEARCANVRVAYNGTCANSRNSPPSPSVAEGSPALPEDCMASANIVDPICVVMPDSTRSVEFQNPCYARAVGVELESGQYMYYRGRCSAECDAKCNFVDGTQAQAYRPANSVSCCENGLDFPSLCYAQCVGGINATGLRRCYRGYCATGRALYGLVHQGNCPEGSVSNGRCKRVGCYHASCPQDPTATCYNLQPCDKFFRLSYLDNICGAVWLSKTGELSTSGCNPPSYTPAPVTSDTCAMLGQTCSLANSSLPPGEAASKVACCPGMTCWAGDVPRIGQVNGTCMTPASIAA